MRAHEVGVMLDAFRAVLALVAVLLGLEIESEDRNLQAATYGFCAYAALLLLFRIRNVRAPKPVIVHWLDAAWCLLLFAMARGASGFFVLLFFPGLFAAVSVGLRASIAVVITCGLAAAAIVLQYADDAPLQRLIIAPAALLLLGPTLALLASGGVQVGDSSSFGAELADKLDARRGLDAVVRTLLDATTSRFGCSAAMLAISSRQGVLRVFRWAPAQPVVELQRDEALALVNHLDVLAYTGDVSFARALAWLARVRYSAVDLQTGASVRIRNSIRPVSALAHRLARNNVVLVPGRHGGATTVWLLLGRDRPPFRQELQLALHEIVEQTAPILDNAMLREELMTAIAETERARIGRDLHDSAIQPYIGLKLAIEALARRVPAESPLAQEISAVARVAADEVSTLREMISGLRGTGGRADVVLEQAVRRQAARFAALFDMQVDVVVEGELTVNRRLSAELLHMVSEGLSNVRRHTAARRAEIRLTGGRQLTLAISNEVAPGEPAPRAFEPRSLAERAAELGGTTSVEIDPHSATVRVSIPWPGGSTT